MKKNNAVDSLYRNTKKTKPLLIIIVLLLLAIVFFVVFSFVKVYRDANDLANKEAEPFSDVAENAMPIHTPVSFSSEDESIQLEGWFFKRTTEAFRGNIIFVHNNRDNRIQFNIEIADLYSFFMDEGFNVLAFDLRNCGRSGGQLSTYGYAEYQDIISAMQQMYSLTGEKDFILYGVGNGTATSILAWNKLSSSIENNNSDGNIDMTGDSITKKDIIGLILDTPAATADDFIRADLPDSTIFNRLITSKFVPTAIKAIAGYSGETNLIPMITQFSNPVLITRNLPNTKIDKNSIDAFIDERLRLQPSTTTVFETAEAGHLNGFNLDEENYLKQLNSFLDIWFPNLYTEENDANS